MLAKIWFEEPPKHGRGGWCWNHFAWFAIYQISLEKRNALGRQTKGIQCFAHPIVREGRAMLHKSLGKRTDTSKVGSFAEKTKHWPEKFEPVSTTKQIKNHSSPKVTENQGYLQAR